MKLCNEQSRIVVYKSENVLIKISTCSRVIVGFRGWYVVWCWNVVPYAPPTMTSRFICSSDSRFVRCAQGRGAYLKLEGVLT